MIEKMFAKRLSELRMLKNVSAREMSLAIGQNQGYINNIENGNNLPSMMAFFYICDYLEITPMDFSISTRTIRKSSPLSMTT